MSKSVIYPFKGRRLAILTLREHLCGFFEDKVDCLEAGIRVDPDTGHHVCLSCDRVTFKSGLRECDICEREYINLNKYENPRYDTNCPDCVVNYGV